jgi:hypothetical protein
MTTAGEEMPMAKRNKDKADIVGAAKDVVGKLPDVTAVPAAIGTTVKRVRPRAITREDVEEIVRRVIREELAGSKRKRKT